MVLYDVSRNIWALEIITHAMNQLKQLKLPEGALIPGKDDEHKRIYVTICSMQRNAIERIALLIYKFDNFSIFPTTIPQEMAFLAEMLRRPKRPAG